MEAERKPDEGYAWIWLPRATVPLVAGSISWDRDQCQPRGAETAASADGGWSGMKT